MSKGLELLRERMVQYLTQRGVNAMSAWPQGWREAPDDPVVVVSLNSCQAGPSGYQDYLGERYNQEAGRWEELYGRRVKLYFGLDIWADLQEGDESVQLVFDKLALALQEGGPEGLSVREVSCQRTEYDGGGRLLKRPAQAECTAYLYAVTEMGGAFLDFEIRGGIKQ